MNINKNLLSRGKVEKPFLLYVSRKCKYSRDILQNMELDKAKIVYLNRADRVPEFVEAVPMLVHNKSKKFWVGLSGLSEILPRKQGRSGFA